MRLIDADALKKAINDDGCRHSHYFDIFDVIDNAPTVEVPENAVNCVLTMFGNCSYNKTGCSDCEIKDKIRKALNDRKKGEWIIDSEPDENDNVLTICPFCRHSDTHAKNIVVSYCWNCGADMRTKNKGE